MPSQLHGLLNLDAFVDGVIQESEQWTLRLKWVEVGADSPLVHNTDGRSDRLAYVISCRSCYLVDSVCMWSCLLLLEIEGPKVVNFMWHGIVRFSTIHLFL